jgi:hypothetical protein
MTEIQRFADLDGPDFSPTPPPVRCPPWTAGCAATDMPSAFAAMRQGGGPGRRVISGGGPLVPVIIFHGDRDTTVHPNNGTQVNRPSVRRARKKRCVAGRYLEGMPTPARPISMWADAKSWSTGISTAPATRGREAALRAPTLIRKDRTRRGKCCVSSSGIRSHISRLVLMGSRHEREVPTKSLLLFEPQRLRLSSFSWSPNAI